jgi:hypothetical protein
VRRSTRSSVIRRVALATAFAAAVAGAPGTPPRLDVVPVAAVTFDSTCTPDGTPVPVLVSKTTGGGAANGSSTNAAISRDGKTVAYQSTATNLAADSGTDNIVRTTLATGAHQLASGAARGEPGNGTHRYPALSGNGEQTVFESNSTNLGTDRSTSAEFATGGKVTIPNNAALDRTGAMTLEAWIRPTQTGAYQWIVTKSIGNGGTNNNYELRLNPSSQLQFLQVTGSPGVLQTVTSPGAIPLNTWSHVAAVRTSTTAVLYVNGSAVVTDTTYSGTTSVNDDPVRIGARGDVARYNGRIQEVALYGTALTATQVGNHYRAGFAYQSMTRTMGVIGYWRLEDRSGTIARDWSSSVRDGTYSGTYSLGHRGALADHVTSYTDAFKHFRDASFAEWQSLDTSYVAGNGSSTTPSTDDYLANVAFASVATNLVAGDTNAVRDIFVRTEGAPPHPTTRVSVDSNEVQANGSSDHPQISGDGRYVVFTSTATNLVTGDTNGVADVFVRDRSAGTTKRVSLGLAGLQPNGASSYPTISRDGTYVAFQSVATNLVAGDLNGSADVFVVKLADGTITAESIKDGSPVAPWGSPGGFAPSLSADGRYVSFGSMYSTVQTGRPQSGVLIRDRNDGSAYTVATTTGTTLDPVLTTAARPLSNLSGDGTRLVVHTTTAHVVADTNTLADVYLFTRPEVTKAKIDEFKALWGPRADDAAFIETWVDSRDVPTAIQNEGFHGLSAGTKRFLADCLLAEFEDEAELTSAYGQRQHDELSRMLHDFIFDKGTYIDYQGSSVTGADPTQPTVEPAQLVPDGMRAALDAVSYQAPPAADAAVVPGVTSTPRSPSLSGILADDPSVGTTHALPRTVSDLAPALDAGNTDVAAGTVAAADDAMTGTGLDRPLDDVHRYAIGAPLVETHYGVCWRSAANATAPEATCETKTVGEPAVVDVTGDGAPDVTAQFLPVGSPATTVPVSGAAAGAKFTLTRATGAPTGDLKAHVWMVYDLPLISRRVAVGFDGYTRGATLSHTSAVTYTLDDLLRTLNGDLMSNYDIDHTAPGASVAMTASVARLNPDNTTTDPVDASLLMSPVPLRLAGRIDSTRSEVTVPNGGGAVTTSTRGFLVTAAPSQATVLKPILGHRATQQDPSGERVEQRRITAVIDDLAAEARLKVESVDVDSNDDAADAKTVSAEVDHPLGSPAEDVRVAQWTTPDMDDPDTESRVAVRVLGLPSRVEVSSEAKQSTRTFGIDSTDSTDSATVSTADYVDGALTHSRTATAVDVPATATLTYDRTAGDNGLKLDYEASAPTTEVRFASRDAADGAALTARVQGIPATWSAEADSTTKTVKYSGGSPIGLIDVAYGTKDARPYRPAEEHATLVRKAEGIAIGFRLAQLKSAVLTHTEKTSAVVRLGSGGRPFVLAYRDAERYAYLRAAELPAVVDVTIDPTQGTFEYDASSGISALHGYFTKRGTGPTVDAVVTGVPAEMLLTVTKGDPVTGFGFEASAGIASVAAMYSPASVERIDEASDPHVAMTAHDLPANWTARMDTAAKYATWSADTEITDITLSALNMGEPGTAFLGAVTGVPTGFRVDYPKGKVELSQLTSPIDTVLVAVSTHGQVHTLPGAHAAFHKSDSAGTFDASLLIRNLSHARFDHLDTGFKLTGSFDYGTEALKVDVRRDAPIARGTGDEERLAVHGRVTNVPSGFTVAKNDKVLTYTSAGKPGVHLTAEHGWIAALAKDSTPPPVRYGLSLRDVGCTEHDGCRPASEGPFCDEAAGTCAAVIATVNLHGLPDEFRADLAAGTYTLKGYAPAPENSTVKAYADLRHVLGQNKVRIDARQEGVSGPLDMTFGPFGGDAGEGKQSAFQVRTAFSKPLGRFYATADFTGAGAVTQAQGTLDITNVPATIDVTVTAGGKMGVAVENSAAVDAITATVHGVYADGTGKAHAKLTQIPATMAITADAGTKPAVDGEAQGMRVPSLTYRAGADTLDGSLQVNAPFVKQAGPAKVAVPRIEFSFSDLGRAVDAKLKYKEDEEGNPTKDIEHVEIVSKPATGWLQIGADVLVDVPKKEFEPIDKSAGDDLSVKLYGHAAAKLEVRDFQVRLTAFEGTRLWPGEMFLAWGWTAIEDPANPGTKLDHGFLEIDIKEFELLLDVEVNLEITPSEVAKAFIKSDHKQTLKLFDADGNPNNGRQPYTSVVFHAGIDREGPIDYFKRDYYGDPEADSDCVWLDVRPRPVIGRNAQHEPIVWDNAISLPPPNWNSEEDGTDFVFTFLDPGTDPNPDDDEGIPDVLIELATAGFLSPLEKVIKPGVGSECPST